MHYTPVVQYRYYGGVPGSWYQGTPVDNTGLSVWFTTKYQVDLVLYKSPAPYPYYTVRLKLTVHEIRRSNIAKLSRQNLRSSYSGNFMATLRSQRLNSTSIHTSNDRSRELKFISYMKISSLVRRNIIVIDYNENYQHSMLHHHHCCCYFKVISLHIVLSPFSSAPTTSISLLSQWRLKDQQNTQLRRSIPFATVFYIG